MRGGRLRHLVVIQKNTPGQSGSGAEVPSWATFATTYAAVEPIKGREYFQAGRVNAETTHLITIRHAAGVDEGMRVSWDGRLFDITSAINIEERDREMQLVCTERKEAA